jgi:hypothetical protein
MTKKTLLSAALSMALLSGCAGIRETNNQFSTHAECFRVVGFPIPADDQAAARSLVPHNGKITTIHSTPADWTSVIGGLENLFGFHMTTVSGTK